MPTGGWRRSAALLLILGAALALPMEKDPERSTRAGIARGSGDPIVLTDRELAALSGGSRTLICLLGAAANGCDLGGAIGGFLDQHGCGGLCGAAGCSAGAAAGFIRGVFKSC